MKGKITAAVALAIASTVLSLIAGEMYVRYSGRVDMDGNFYFRFKRLRPYKLPIKQTELAVDAYLKTDASYILYDPDLGWTIRPDSVSADGLYKSNSLGIRSAPSETAIEPARGRLRIALLGDSYTHANDVSFEDSWGRMLELELKEKGIDAEVLNFGVPAYGIDQACLRWKKEARIFSPQIVIFGFVADDVSRNLNMFWSIRSPGMGFFFSKPRFLLKGDKLEIVNHPSVSPENMVNLLKNFDKSEVAQYEYFYYRSDYRRRFWHKSKLFTLLFDTAGENIYKDKNISGRALLRDRRLVYDLDLTPARLALKFIEDLRKDVEAHNGHFIVVHFFGYGIMNRLASGKKLFYADLLDKLDKDYRIIRPEKVMLEGGNIESIRKLFAEQHTTQGDVKAPGHYSREGNKIIADLLAERIVRLKMEQFRLNNGEDDHLQ